MTDRMQETKPGFRPHREDFQADWTKNIPEHWEVRRLKFVAKTIAGQSPPSEIVSAFTGRYPFLQGNAEFGATSPSPRLSCEKPNKSAEPGDILLSVRAPVGAMNIADQIYGIGRGLCAIRANTDIYQEFLYHTLTTTKETLKGASTGSTYDAVSIGDVASISTPVPPPEEQAAIVRFLDHADEKIQRYIAGKERLIDLLAEQRQAVIHQAVTRGLDPNVRLKDSGVEWLGDVPEHWEVARFARQVNIAEGQADPSIEPYASMLMIAPNHVESGTGRLLSRETAYEQGAISGKYFCRAGDVVYSKIRPALAKVLVAPTDCLCSADMYPLRPRNSLQRDYLFWLLLSTGFTAWSVLQSDRVAMPKINRQTLNNVHIPLPPLSEQVSIVRHLIEATAKASGAIDRVRRQIELMEEYRTRLIADVVTGKLDVREFAGSAK